MALISSVWHFVDTNKCSSRASIFGNGQAKFVDIDSNSSLSGNRRTCF